MDKQISRHWIYVFQHFMLDVVLFVGAFVAGTYLRFGPGWRTQLVLYSPAFVGGAICLACCAYIFGLYSRYRVEHRFTKRLILYSLAFHLAIIFVIGFGYLDWSARIGRGVMMWSYGIGGIACILHHLVIIARVRLSRERVAFVVNSDFDAAEAKILEAIESKHLSFVGTISGPDFHGGKALSSPEAGSKWLGRIDDFQKIIRANRISRVLCTEGSVGTPAMRSAFCHLRYSGVRVSSLASLCEEVYQFMPLELVTPQWLLSASDLPQVLYIRKMKRAFDVVVSLLGLVVLGPVALLAALMIRLSSKGPVLFRQIRTGRFGKPFQVLKLRSMTVDAEADGVRWSSPNDARVTWLGRFLRRYRIDEIPQMINVLKGEMSFVGPRPERPEFVESLQAVIPFYEERMFAQPGITGWAQVRFPYGENVKDARRKLEYDLYYIKHMSIFLDSFILLDTVRIILLGGARNEHRDKHPLTRAISEHKLEAEDKSQLKLDLETDMEIGSKSADATS